jgi:hypothetical protein
MKKRLNSTQRKTVIFFALLVLGLGAFFVNYQKGEVVIDREEVVFIRSLEKDGFDYVATVDQASNLLPDSSNKETIDREVIGVANLVVSADAKVFLVEEKGSVSVRDLTEKIASDSTYVGRVFTVGISGEKIVSIKEEDL